MVHVVEDHCSNYYLPQLKVEDNYSNWAVELPLVELEEVLGAVHNFHSFEEASIGGIVGCVVMVVVQ